MPPTYGNYESCLESSCPARVLVAIRDSVAAGWSHGREWELALHL